MDVNGDIDVRADGFADERSDGQVRYVMVVHYVEMDPVGPRGHDIADFFAEAREVGG